MLPPSIEKCVPPSVCLSKRIPLSCYFYFRRDLLFGLSYAIRIPSRVAHRRVGLPIFGLKFVPRSCQTVDGTVAPEVYDRSTIGGVEQAPRTPHSEFAREDLVHMRSEADGFLLELQLAESGGTNVNVKPTRGKECAGTATKQHAQDPSLWVVGRTGGGK